MPKPNATTATARVVLKLAAAVARPDPYSRLLGVIDVLDAAQLWGTALRAGAAYAAAEAARTVNDWPVPDELADYHSPGGRGV